MRPDAGDAARLRGMLGAWARIAQHVAGRSRREFLDDDSFRSAVERQVEIIGEAARGVSDAFRRAHPEVPRRPIIARRHVLAHEYGEVQPEPVWRVATVHVPALATQSRARVPPPADGLRTLSTRPRR